MKKKNHQIARTYLIANENTPEEAYFSVRSRWIAYLQENNPRITANEVYERALQDDASLLKVLPKETKLNAV